MPDTSEGNVEASPKKKKAHSLALKELNSLLTCHICKGYLIEATTVADCLHSFCRSCLVRSLFDEAVCPQCSQPLHQPFTTIRRDRALQGLVYKLVPGLYEKEMARRKVFYSCINPNKSKENLSPEKLQDEELPTVAYSVNSSDPISVELRCVSDTSPLMGAPPCTTAEGGGTGGGQDRVSPPVFYLLCPPDITVHHLDQLIRAKFDLFSQADNKSSNPYSLTLFMWAEECLSPHFSLLDIAVMYSWDRQSPLQLYFAVCCDASTEVGVGVEASMTTDLLRVSSQSQASPDHPGGASNRSSFGSVTSSSAVSTTSASPSAASSGTSDSTGSGATEVGQASLDTESPPTSMAFSQSE